MPAWSSQPSPLVAGGPRLPHVLNDALDVTILAPGSQCGVRPAHDRKRTVTITFRHNTPAGSRAAVRGSAGTMRAAARHPGLQRHADHRRKPGTRRAHQAAHPGVPAHLAGLDDGAWPAARETLAAASC